MIAERDTDLQSRNLRRALPELIGTLRQVEWADAVRDERMTEIEVILSEMKRGAEILREGGFKERAEEARLDYYRMQQAARLLRVRTKASWWISRRALTAEQLLASVDAT